MSYEVKKSETVFTGRRIRVQRDIITMPDGKEALRDTVMHNGAACIIPVCSNGDIIFVRQYRHPAKKFTVEIPAGTLEPKENPLHCAVRELEEETSYKAGKISLLFEMYSAIGICNELLHIYVAEDLTEGSFNPDPDEFINTERHSLEEALAMIDSGEICDGKTIAALFMYKHKML